MLKIILHFLIQQYKPSKLSKGSPNDWWQAPLRRSTMVLISKMASLVSRMAISISRMVGLKREKLIQHNRVLQHVRIQGFWHLSKSLHCNQTHRGGMMTPELVDWLKTTLGRQSPSSPIHTLTNTITNIITNIHVEISTPIYSAANLYLLNQLNPSSNPNQLITSKDNIAKPRVVDSRLTRVQQLQIFLRLDIVRP